MAVANPISKVLRERNVAKLGRREAAAPSKAIAFPGCKVGAVIHKARSEV